MTLKAKPIIEMGVPVVPLPPVAGTLYALERVDGQHRVAFMQTDPDNALLFKPAWQDISREQYNRLLNAMAFAQDWEDHAAGFDYIAYDIDAQIRAMYDEMLDAAELAAELAEVEAAQFDASIYGQV